MDPIGFKPPQHDYKYFAISIKSIETKKALKFNNLRADVTRIGQISNRIWDDITMLSNLFY